MACPRLEPTQQSCAHPHNEQGIPWEMPCSILVSYRNTKPALSSGVANNIAATLAVIEHEVYGTFSHNHGTCTLDLHQCRNRAASSLRRQVSIDIDRGTAMRRYWNLLLIDIRCRI